MDDVLNDLKLELEKEITDLRLLLYSRGFTVADVARALHRSHSTVRDWFRGCRPNANSLIRLARLLDVPAEDLARRFLRIYSLKKKIKELREKK